MEVLPQDEAWLRGIFARGLRPNPRRTVAQWADAERVVSEGPAQGRWRTSRTPYLREPMEKATLRHPCRRVVIRGGAQTAKTQAGLNILGQVLVETPANALVVLPSQNSMRMYNRDKLEPMIRDSPSLRDAVADVTSRDGTGSTTTVKRGLRNAQVELVSANSSADLQSRTARLVLLEEVTEYPEDTDGRGHPADQAIARTIAFRKVGEKVVYISTPGVKGRCRITKEYEAGSRALFHVPCLHCDHMQTLRLDNLRWPEGQPERAAYSCEACGALHGEPDKMRMLARGDWVHQVPDLEDIAPSYTWSTLYSPMAPWSEFAKEYDKAQGDPTKLKTFWQQWLGEPWDEAHDLPKAEILLLRRDRWQRGRVPPGVLFLQGATDVQGDRLEWAVWGFDAHFGQWLIDTGVIEGDPTRPEPWQAHDELLRRRWLDAWGKPIAPECWGIDAGYLSSQVYAYARRHASDAEPMVRALDGRAAWRLPPLGTPVQRDVDWNGQKLGTVRLWPVGTWDMKSELAAALRLTEQGPGPDGWSPGALRFNEIADLGWLNQLLSERFVENPRTGVRSWQKVTPRNEAWDLAVYCRALARHDTASFTAKTWAALAARRSGAAEAAQPDLAALWAPDLKAQAEMAAREKIEEANRFAAAAPPPRQPAPEEEFFAGSESIWGD